MSKLNRILLILGSAFILISLTLMILLNVPTKHEKNFTFQSTYKEDDVTLKGTYYEVKGAEHAVLICTGYSCDRQKWRPIADLFVSNGISVMTFDFSGQASSYGRIGFDNAKTDAISVEINDALEKLHDISNIPYENLILFGHSMGGRSILRLLYDYNDPNAETTVDKHPVGNAILFSPEVNYSFSAQASLFAGTSDDVEEPWKSYTDANTVGTNIYLFGSTADDVVNSECILGIYSHLGGTLPDGKTKGTYSSKQVNSVGSTIVCEITRGILHSYQMYSPEFAAYTNSAIEDITGTIATYSPNMFYLIYIGWFFALAGVFLTLYSLTHKKDIVCEEVPTLYDPKKFLLKKLFLWLPGIGVAFLVCCLCIVFPFGSPIMNIPYMCFIAGYGIVMFFSYKKQKVSGTEGTLPKMNFHLKKNKKDLFMCLIVVFVIVTFVWYVLRSTMYRLMPLNIRWFWLLFATAFMTFGYYVSSCEGDMLRKSHASFKVKFLYNLIQYVALFLFVLFYLVIKSYSGVIGQAQNLLLMYILCIPIGDFIREKTGNRLLGAILSAFLFQAIMINSAAIISMF